MGGPLSRVDWPGSQAPAGYLCAKLHPLLSTPGNMWGHPKKTHGRTSPQQVRSHSTSRCRHRPSTADATGCVCRSPAPAGCWLRFHLLSPTTDTFPKCPLGSRGLGRAQEWVKSTLLSLRESRGVPALPSLRVSLPPAPQAGRSGPGTSWASGVGMKGGAHPGLSGSKFHNTKHTHIFV